MIQQLCRRSPVKIGCEITRLDDEVKLMLKAKRLSLGIRPPKGLTYPDEGNIGIARPIGHHAAERINPIEDHSPRIDKSEQLCKLPLEPEIPTIGAMTDRLISRAVMGGDEFDRVATPLGEPGIATGGHEERLQRWWETVCDRNLAA